MRKIILEVLVLLWKALRVVLWKWLRPIMGVNWYFFALAAMTLRSAFTSAMRMSVHTVRWL